MEYAIDRTAIDALLRFIALAFEIGAVTIIVVGTTIASLIFIADVIAQRGPERAFRRYRAGLARSILLAVELLIAADLIGTVIVEPSVDNLITLAAIIAIRTFLSFALEVEVDGRVPWRR